VGEPVGVGLVGCGKISGQYLQTLSRVPGIRLVAVADLDPARAQAVADAHQGVRAVPLDELVRLDEVGAVLNLTIPAAHATVAAKAIEAGKDVYNEKPLAMTVDEASALVEKARAAGVRFGCAPDTVLGTGIQTARKLVDDGAIGTPTAATAVMLTPGHERWHPDPDFYYVPGGGPLFDMGPYYVSALVHLLGPVTSVLGAGHRDRAERVIGSGPRAGAPIPVTVDTHVTGVLVHASGALSTLVMSFESVATKGSAIEVHGRTGSIAVPDPNQFSGTVEYLTLGDTAWRTQDPSAGYADTGRGIGLADMVAGPPDAEPRAGAQIGFHVLDIMESLLRSAGTGASVRLQSTCDRPAPVPLTATV
jgi:predicted dehydrogenase